MSTYPVVHCDNCDKQVKEKEAHGWFSLRTVVTKPSREAYAAIIERYGPEMARAAGVSEGAATPEQVGGEFCSPTCLREYVTTAELLLSVPKEDV